MNREPVALDRGPSTDTPISTDESQVPAYELPDPLSFEDGGRVDPEQHLASADRCLG